MLFVVTVLIFALPMALINAQSGVEEVSKQREQTPKADFEGRFGDGCPPSGAMISDDQSPRPSQKSDPKLSAKLVSVKEFDGTVVRKVETRAFCLFLDDDVIKGVMNQWYLGR